MIDQPTEYTVIRAVETFFEPLQLHLQPADLLQQLGFLGLPLVLKLSFLAPGEKLAGAVQQLPFPLAHLDRVDDVVGSDLLDRLAATERLHGDPGLELGAVGAALTQLLRTRLRLRVEPPWRGSAPPQRFTIGLSRNARPPQLTKANRQQLQGCAWQCCRVHFARNLMQ